MFEVCAVRRGMTILSCLETRIRPLTTRRSSVCPSLIRSFALRRNVIPDGLDLLFNIAR